jgi:hypothetical protein
VILSLLGASGQGMIEAEKE